MPQENHETEHIAAEEGFAAWQALIDAIIEERARLDQLESFQGPKSEIKSIQGCLGRGTYFSIQNSHLSYLLLVQTVADEFASQFCYALDLIQISDVEQSQQHLQNFFNLGFLQFNIRPSTQHTKVDSTGARTNFFDPNWSFGRLIPPSNSDMSTSSGLESDSEDRVFEIPDQNATPRTMRKASTTGDAENAWSSLETKPNAHCSGAREQKQAGQDGAQSKTHLLGQRAQISRATMHQLSTSGNLSQWSNSLGLIPAHSPKNLIPCRFTQLTAMIYQHIPEHFHRLANTADLPEFAANCARVILFGPASLEDKGSRRPQNQTLGQLWHVVEPNAALISFVCTTAVFICYWSSLEDQKPESFAPIGATSKIDFREIYMRFRWALESKADNASIKSIIRFWHQHVFKGITGVPALPTTNRVSERIDEEAELEAARGGLDVKEDSLVYSDEEDFDSDPAPAGRGQPAIAATAAVASQVIPHPRVMLGPSTASDDEVDESIDSPVRPSNRRSQAHVIVDSEDDTPSQPEEDGRRAEDLRVQLKAKLKSLKVVDLRGYERCFKQLANTQGLVHGQEYIGVPPCTQLPPPNWLNQACACCKVSGVHWLTSGIEWVTMKAFPVCVLAATATPTHFYPVLLLFNTAQIGTRSTQPSFHPLHSPSSMPFPCAPPPPYTPEALTPHAALRWAWEHEQHAKDEHKHKHGGVGVHGWRLHVPGGMTVAYHQFQGMQQRISNWADDAAQCTAQYKSLFLLHSDVQNNTFYNPSPSSRSPTRRTSQGMNTRPRSWVHTITVDVVSPHNSISYTAIPEFIGIQRSAGSLKSNGSIFDAIRFLCVGVATAATERIHTHPTTTHCPRRATEATTSPTTVYVTVPIPQYGGGGMQYVQAPYGQVVQYRVPQQQQQRAAYVVNRWDGKQRTGNDKACVVAAGPSSLLYVSPCTPLPLDAGVRNISAGIAGSIDKTSVYMADKWNQESMPF
ncbi:hypothetical protein B0H14DRAFT_2586784 [Mycena olivaceomarginata]|nr:hypothetical protein B0H14DRAFT_2586784 [Mycena olivaceomarginata]